MRFSKLICIFIAALSNTAGAGLICGNFKSDRDRIASFQIIAIARVVTVSKSKISFETMKAYKGVLPPTFEYLDDPELTDNDVALDNFKTGESYLITVNPVAIKKNRIWLNYCNDPKPVATAKTEVSWLDAHFKKRR